jgi:hypothetical protein
MIADLTCGISEKGNAMAAMALVVAMIDLLNSSGKISDDEVSDICRNAQALFPEVGGAAADARKVVSSIRLSRIMTA